MNIEGRRQSDNFEFRPGGVNSFVQTGPSQYTIDRNSVQMLNQLREFGSGIATDARNFMFGTPRRGYNQDPFGVQQQLQDIENFDLPAFGERPPTPLIPDPQGFYGGTPTSLTNQLGF